MNEPRPLPMGDAEFNIWAVRIISGANIPGVEHNSLSFALASMLTQLGPTESHKPDAFFIHSLRKAAANQVALHKMEQIKALRKDEQARAEQEKAEQDLKLVSTAET